MKVLVTGGAGFIGSHIVDALINRGDEVICVDDESAPQNQNFYWNERAKNVIVDIRKVDARVLYEGVDVVFHLAARSRIQPTVNNPSECFSVNMLGTQEVLEASRRAGVKRIVYSGSSSYYGNRNAPPFKEDMLPGCATPYSLSKWQGEQVCELYTKLYGLSTVSLRYFNVYGPREPLQGEYAPVMGLFRRQLRESKPMTVVGDGEQRRDFTYIDDVVSANLLAAEKLDVHGIINIGTGRNYSINDLTRMIGGRERYVEHLPERVGETRITLADNTRSRVELGWEPKVSLVDVINSY
jgi:UDP-glucose 4-epimerase